MDSSMYYKALHDSAAADVDSAALGNSAEHTASPRVEDGSVSMDNFYPALVQCFGIIICG